MSRRIRGINYRVLTVLLLVGIPVLLIGAWLVIEDGRAELREAFAQRLAQRAEQSAAAIDAYVYRRIVDVALLARVPDVRAVAEAANRRPFDVEAARALDRRFASLDLESPEIDGVLDNPASRYLADITRQDPIYHELLLTDRSGRLAAASNLTSDYFQADEDWWRRVMADPARGESTISDVSWDDSARTHAMEIAVPVAGPDGRPVGVLKAVTDLREMLASMVSTDLGAGSDAMLLRRNGTIVFSRHAVDARTRFFGASRMRERLEAVQGEGPSRLYFHAQTADGEEQLVGVATSQLATTYPHLPWVVAIWQPSDVALAPVDSLFRELLLVLALTALAVLVMAMYFSVRLAAPPVEIDMELVPHPHVARVADEESI